MSVKSSYTNIKDSVSVGNRTLYNLCEEHPLSATYDDNEIDSLASKIWLIGRSYAASPERRNYISGNELLEMSLKTSDDGENFFFEQLAKNIIKNNKYKRLIDLVDRYKKTFFKDASGSKRNEELLRQEIEIVFMFNDILRKSIRKIDAKSINEKKRKGIKGKIRIKQFVSFSSKFMHFHLPYIVFIYDNFSSNHTKKHKKGEYFFVKNGKKEISFCESDYKNLFNKISNNYNKKIDNKELEYIRHACISYLVLYKLRDKHDTSITPRMVDNFLLAVNHRK